MFLRWYQDIEEAINSFELKLLPGKANVVADALSRRPDHSLNILKSLSNDFSSAFKQSYEADPFEAELNADLDADSDSRPFFFDDGLLYWKSVSGPRAYVPATNNLREIIVSEHHDIGLAGHLGVNKTVQYIQRRYYWPNMKKMVREYIQSCEFCQRNKHLNQAPAGLLLLWLFPIRNGTVCLWIL